MLDRLLNIKALQNVRTWLYSHQPLNSRLSWYEFLKGMGNKIIETDTSERAASVAFNLMLAIFPTIIFLFTLIPFIPIPNLDEQILSFFEHLLPGETFTAAYSTIRDIVSRPRSNVLSFGFILALYSATSGTMALMHAFNSSHRSTDSRGFLKMRLIAVGLTFMLAVSLILAVVILIVGDIITNYLVHFGLFNNDLFINFLTFTRFIIVFAVFVGSVSVIYKYGPDVELKWAFITPGSVTASFLIVITTLGFSYFVSKFGSYNRVYGSIGTLIALMIWLNLVTLLLIIGFELNIALYGIEGDKHPSVAQKTTDNLPEP